MKSFGVGVIGCGYWGPNLIRNFARHPQCRVLGVCDSRPERAERAARDWAVPVATADPAALLALPGLDLVVVATPSFTHAELAKQALEAGKHVLVMKPLTTSAEDARELIELAASRGLLLAVDHTFVFTGAVRHMRRLIESGEVGELYYFDSVRINLGLIQTDINVLWDLAPHDISIMDYLFQQEPTSVAAQAAGHGGSPTENIAYLTVRFGESLLGHVHVNWLAPAKVRRTIVGGSRKMIVYDDVEPSEKLKIYDKGVSISGERGTDNEYRFMISYRSGDMHAPQLDTTEALAVEVDNIVQAMMGKEPLVSDGAAGERVVRILEAAQRSIEQGGMPVALAAVGASELMP
jgi:predicted dehydrogenase